MSIEIDQELCIGCGKCADVCPGSLIRRNAQNKVEIPCPERCWGCVSCVKECPVRAIEFYLGEDMGGLGGRMTVRREDTLLHWMVRMPDGREKVITVDSSDANQY